MADHETASRGVALGVFDLLAAGPIPLTEMATTLRSRGLLDHVDADLDAQIDAVLAAIVYRDEVWISRNEVVVLADHALDDVVFTHRVSASEIDRQMLDAAPDLDPIDHGRLAPLHLDGRPVERRYAEEDPIVDDAGSFVGPDGWLQEFAAGDLLAVHRTGDSLRISRVDEPFTADDGTAEAHALRAAFDARIAEPGVGQLIDTLVLDVLTDRPGLFTMPVPPLSDLLARVGLECRGEWTGPAGTDWLPPYLAARASERDILAERYLLDECCLELFDRVMEVWNEFVLTPDAEDLPWSDVAVALDHGGVAPAFTDHILGADVEPLPQLDAFARQVATAGHRRAKAVGPFLQARNLEHGGDVALAEAYLYESVHHNPSFVPALDDLAWYVADRGDADQAVNLLRRAGSDQDDPEVRLLESLRPRRNLVGRNERCPCGSGRKYKDCCQRNPVLPLEQRAVWLEHKLWTFTLRPQRQHLPLGLAAEMAMEDDDDTLDELLAIGLPMDLAAFELGLAAEFLDHRGELLPADERALLETWIARPRSLYEIVERSGRSGLVVRDLSTGELAAVTGLDEPDRELGGLLLARIAPLGDSHQFVGVPIDVSTDLRGSAEALVASRPDAWAIAEWFADAIYGAS